MEKVFHFGLYPKMGLLEIWDGEEHKRYDFMQLIDNTYDDLIEKMLEGINEFIDKETNNTGKLGCIGVFLDPTYSNSFRKKLINWGKYYGFAKVEIIDKYGAMYMNAIHQAKPRINENDMIWIFRAGGYYIWHKQKQKVKFLGFSTDSLLWRNTKKELGLNVTKNPDVIICRDSDANDIYSMRSAFPLQKIHIFTIEDYFEISALMRARILADELVGSEFDIDHILDEDISLKLDGNEVFKFSKFQILPLEHSFEISNNAKKLEIFIGKTNIEETYHFSNSKKSLVIIKIDTNRIYSLILIDLPLKNVSDFEKYNYALCAKWDGEVKEKSKFFDSYVLPQKITTNNSNINAVGIDLGTTRCFLAVNRKYAIETIAIDNTGERMLPSYVGFDEKTEKCGKVVINRLNKYASSTVFDSKRIIGKDFDDIAIDPTWPFELLNINNETHIRIKGYDGIITKYPQEVAAVLLGHMKSKAEEFQGKSLNEVVITVPAAFTENQIKKTRVAALIAGWKKINILPEPIAATFAYFIDVPIPNNANILLFDLGGGTLDICIFKINCNLIKIISSNGDPNIGGRNFDNLLFNYFINELKTKYQICDVGNRKYKLMLKCQEVKETLTASENGCIDVMDCDPSKDGIIEISREQFEKMAASLLTQIKCLVRRTLEKSKNEMSEIKQVLQVGGGCRMPMIKKMLNDIFPNAKHSCEENPEEVVAIGAAYYAYCLNLNPRERCVIM